MNKNVIYTVIVGSYDSLHNIKKERGFDYICFTDRQLTSNVWEIRPLPEDVSKSDLSSSKKNRKIKILAHKYLAQYDLSIYIDGSVTILGSMSEYIKQYCKQEDGYIFIPKHGHRDCIYKEASICIKLKKDTSENINKQIEGYKKEKFPEHYGLTHNCIIIRYHNNENCKRLMELWWNEVKNKSHRDQLSLFYVLWKDGKSKINQLDKHTIESKYFKWSPAHY